VTQSDPNNVAALGALGEVFLVRQMHERLRANEDHLLTFEPKNAEAHYRKGMANLGMELYDEALSSFTQAILLQSNHAILLQSNHAKAYVGRARVYRIKNDSARVKADLDAALRLGANDALTLAWHGMLAKGDNKLQDALTDFNKALAQKPDSVDLHVQRGEVAFMLGDFTQAVSDFEYAIRYRPQDARLQFNLGNGYLETGKFHRAVEAFTAVLNNDPQDAHALLARAMAYLKHGEAGLAKNDCETALPLTSDKPALRRIADDLLTKIRLRA